MIQKKSNKKLTITRAESFYYYVIYRMETIKDFFKHFYPSGRKELAYRKKKLDEIGEHIRNLEKQINQLEPNDAVQTFSRK